MHFQVKKNKEHMFSKLKSCYLTCLSRLKKLKSICFLNLNLVIGTHSALGRGERVSGGLGPQAGQASRHAPLCPPGTARVCSHVKYVCVFYNLAELKEVKLLKCSNS